MFRKSRFGIMALVAVVMFFMFAGTLGVIYITTYSKITAENRDMLETYAALYAQNGMPDGGWEQDAVSEEDGVSESPDGTADLSGGSDSAGDYAQPPEGASPDAVESVDTSRRFTVSTFYSVLLDEDGSVLEINNDSMPQLTGEALAALAQSMIESGKTFGTMEDVVYLVTDAGGGTLVTMMDNTVLGESIASLIHYTLIFGCVFAVVALLVSFVLSRYIIRPLEEAYSRQRRFISDAGHELKTPVATISANAELLSREIGENEWLSNIRYENERMSALIRQLLELARIERAAPSHEEVDLSRLVMAGVLPFEGVAFENGVELCYEIAEGVSVKGDATSLGELVSILTDNAVSHTAPGKRVRVVLAPVRGRAVLSVENEGEPIPEAERGKIFERFYRGDSARAGEGAHYGLGLSIAGSIVEAHHGKIGVECGGGVTKFVVTF